MWSNNIIIQTTIMSKNKLLKDCKVLSIANFKGGVGKTTSTLNIGSCLADMGYKVLLIDLDPQFNLTQCLFVNDVENVTIYDILTDKAEIKTKKYNDNLHLIPSYFDLIKADHELSSKFKREFILTNKIEQIKSNYDFILIDCAPNLGLLTLNSFIASDYICVPVEAEYLSLSGFKVLSDAIENNGLEIDFVFVTKFDKRKNINNAVYESLHNNLSDDVFLKTKIRTNVALSESPSHQENIFRYSPKSNGAKDYEKLTIELLNKIL